jgi:hypothetical protein
MSYKRILVTLLLFIFLSSCAQTGTVNTVQAVPTGTSAKIPTLLPSATPTLSPTPTPNFAPMTDFMKGLVYFPAGWGGDKRPEIDWIFENIVLPTGATWIRLHVPYSQDSVESTRVYRGKMMLLPMRNTRMLSKQHIVWACV